MAAIDLRAHDGLHPHVGAIDVAPVVHLDAATRGAAIAAALTAAALIGDELALPVFLYGALAHGRERAEIRAGRPRGAGGADALGRGWRPTTARPSRIRPRARCS